MGIECPQCGKESVSYQGYAIHYTKSSDHTGLPLVALVGERELEEMYWSMGYEEIADELGVGSTTVTNAYDELDFPEKTEANRLEYQYGVPINWLLDALHNTLEKSVNQMSSELDVSRVWIDRQMRKYDIHKRGRSEAESLKWEQMDDEERQQQVKAAHERTRELYKNGNGSFQEWWRENPEEARAHAKEAAALGTPAREENGMKGVSGQDHPRWRGGKNLYDAVKKCIRRESWNDTRERARGRVDRRCEMCSTTQPNRGLDVHYIVPLMCGGTNRDGNLMALCQSCHRIVEAHTRELFDPVLVE